MFIRKELIQDSRYESCQTLKSFGQLIQIEHCLAVFIETIVVFVQVFPLMIGNYENTEIFITSL